MEAERDDDYRAQVILLRDDTTGAMNPVPVGEATDAQIAEATEGAKRRKAVFLHRLDGAEARAGMLPAKLMSALSAGVVDLMLAKVLQEELVPATPDEAMKVAKVALEIYKASSGNTDPKHLSPQEREVKRSEAERFGEVLAKRAREAGANLSGALAATDPVPAVSPGPDDEADEWEHDDPVPDGQTT